MSDSNKYCFYYTMHNHVQDLDLNTQCFNSEDYFKNNFDVVVNCNKKGANEDLIRSIVNKFKSKKTHINFDSVNNGGYHFGPYEQVYHDYDILKQYSVVVHLHPDVYPLEFFGIKKHVEQCEAEEMDFMLFELPGRRGWYGYESAYATDFWMFRPLEKNKRVFNNWEYWQKHKTNYSCEYYMYAETRNSKVGYLDRSPCAGMQWSYEPNMGIISNPRNNEVQVHLSHKK